MRWAPQAAQAAQGGMTGAHIMPACGGEVIRIEGVCGVHGASGAAGSGTAVRNGIAGGGRCGPHIPIASPGPASSRGGAGGAGGASGAVGAGGAAGAGGARRAGTAGAGSCEGLAAGAAGKGASDADAATYNSSEAEARLRHQFACTRSKSRPRCRRLSRSAMSKPLRGLYVFCCWINGWSSGDQAFAAAMSDGRPAGCMASSVRAALLSMIFIGLHTDSKVASKPGSLRRSRTLELSQRSLVSRRIASVLAADACVAAWLACGSTQPASRKARSASPRRSSSAAAARPLASNRGTSSRGISVPSAARTQSRSVQSSKVRSLGSCGGSPAGCRSRSGSRSRSRSGLSSQTL